MKFWITVFFCTALMPHAAAAYDSDSCATLQYEDGTPLITPASNPISINRFVEPGHAGGEVVCTAIYPAEGSPYLQVREWLRHDGVEDYIEYGSDSFAFYQVVEGVPDDALTVQCQEQIEGYNCARYLDLEQSIQIGRVYDEGGTLTQYSINVSSENFLVATDFADRFRDADPSARRMQMSFRPQGQTFDMTLGLYGVYVLAEPQQVFAFLDLLEGDVPVDLFVRAELELPGFRSHSEYGVAYNVIRVVQSNLELMEFLAAQHRAPR